MCYTQIIVFHLPIQGCPLRSTTHVASSLRITCSQVPSDNNSSFRQISRYGDNVKTGRRNMVLHNPHRQDPHQREYPQVTGWASLSARPLRRPNFFGAIQFQRPAPGWLVLQAISSHSMCSACHFPNLPFRTVLLSWKSPGWFSSRPTHSCFGWRKVKSKRSIRNVSATHSTLASQCRSALKCVSTRSLLANTVFLEWVHRTNIWFRRDVGCPIFSSA